MNSEELFKALSENPKHSKLYYKIRRGLDDVRRFPQKIKYFIQRGRRGYDDTSFWSGDTYLAKVIAGVLHDLADNMHGCPSRGDYMIEEPSSENSWIGEFDFQLWEDDLRKNAVLFDQYAESRFDLAEEELEIDEALAFFIENFGSLWD